jgi:nicotinamidase-related amidase
MYTLVVVDMQPGFNAANRERVRQNVRREIKKAVQEGADIVFLEYVSHGRTFPELLVPVEKIQYKRFKVSPKMSDDGSKEVQQVVANNDFMFGRFRVVGINTDYCVMATTLGIRTRFPNSYIEVVADACDSDCDHYQGLSSIEKIPDVDLIN